MGRFWRQRDPSDPGYQALARGLQDFGFGFGANAGTQGFAAAAPAAAYAVQSAGETYSRETERQRREEEERQRRERSDEENRREDVRWDHYLEGIESAKSTEERSKREAEAKAAAEAERRQSMLDEIREAGGDNAARRAALLSPSKLESEYVKITGATEAKPPAIRELGGDWYLFDPSHPDSDEVGYRLYKTEPASSRKSIEQSRSDIRWQQSQEDRTRSEEGRQRSAAEEAAEREVGTWTEYRDARLAELQRLHPGIDFTDDAETATKIPAIRRMYEQKLQEAARRSMGAGATSPAPGNSPRAPAAEPPAQAPSGGGVPEGMTFDQAMAAMRQRIGNKPAAIQAVAEIERAAQVVPPQVRDSREFLEQLRADLLAGKSPQQIAQEIQEAFGGGG